MVLSAGSDDLRVREKRTRTSEWGVEYRIGEDERMRGKEANGAKRVERS